MTIKKGLSCFLKPKKNFIDVPDIYKSSYIWLFTSVEELQQIPSPKKTAQKILDNFVRYHPGQNGKRTDFQEDTVIVIDGSGSIGSCEFREGRKAMLAMMKMCSEKPEGTSCRFAGVTFASSATRNFNYLSVAEASRKMSAVSYPGGGTNTKAGLEEAERIIRAGLYI